MVWPFGSREKKNHTSVEIDGHSHPERLTADNWSSQDCKITVTQKPGFLFNVQLRAKIDAPPDQIFDLLVDPDNSRYFRTVKAVTYRKVLEDDGRGAQKIEVEQAAGWRFLIFSGTFYTRLFVWENKRDRVVRFELAKEGMMKNFEGGWRIQPFNQATLDETTGHGSRLFRFSEKMLSNVTGLIHKPDTSLVTLEQSIAPAMVPPKSMTGYMAKISGNILKTIVDDLREECDRVKSGRPIPKHQLKKLEKAKKMRKEDLPETVHKVQMASVSLSNGRVLDFGIVEDVVGFMSWDFRDRGVLIS